MPVTMTEHECANAPLPLAIVLKSTVQGGGNGGDIVNPGKQLIDKAFHQEIFQLGAVNTNITLTLVSFAVTRKSYGRITKMFTKEYRQQTGLNVRFRLSFGGSGTQARAIIDGLPADIAALALPLDVIRISEAGLIPPNWATRTKHPGAVAYESVVAIVVRDGNPKNIRGWEDLIRDDVNVVTANPRTAGIARWIFLALWGHKANSGDAAAAEYVTKVFDRVEVMPRDAREASDVFYKQGQADCLLTYENEAIFTNLVVPEEDRLPYVVPDNNVRIQCPVTGIDANLEQQSPEGRQAAADFIEYLYTPQAQSEFVACGFRSPLEKIARESEMPEVRKLWTVEKRLGSWNKVNTKFFDLDKGILTKILLDVSKRKILKRMAELGMQTGL